MAESKCSIRVRKLDGTAQEEEIRQILEVCRTVFEVQPGEKVPHSTFEGWHERLSKPKAVILYATKDADDAKPLGFFFIFPRVQPEIGIELPHIWLAGILHEARGTGVFSSLMRETTQYTQEYGYDRMTVCTIPDRFTRMYSILQSTGWQFVAWKEGDDTRSKRVLMVHDV